MSKTLQAVRGMNDILPGETPLWQHIESIIGDTCRRYGCQEIRFPIVESTSLFKRTIGDATDIVEKEMYSFDDRNGDSLTLRPEGTAGCVRAGIEQGLLYNQIQRLWYKGPFFRHERPQKGRYRQFHQVGVEYFGLPSAKTDVEVIALSKRILERIGLHEHVTLEINTLGSLESRTAHRNVLVIYLKDHKNELDEDSLRRLETNPLRILDSKNPDMQNLIEAAPHLIDHLTKSDRTHFDDVKTTLDALGIAHRVNPRLVRGLDYYCHTVFEWVTTSLGAQGTVCAGGRYDSLVEQLGGKATPAVGFAMGLERMVLMLKTLGKERKETPDAYIIPLSEAAEVEGLKLAESLREDAIVMTGTAGSIKSQIKKADKSGARVAIIIGDDELANRKASVKFLREDKEQAQLGFDELGSAIF